MLLELSVAKMVGRSASLDQVTLWIQLLLKNKRHYQAINTYLWKKEDLKSHNFFFFLQCHCGYTVVNLVSINQPYLFLFIYCGSIRNISRKKSCNGYKWNLAQIQIFLKLPELPDESRKPCFLHISNKGFNTKSSDMAVLFDNSHESLTEKHENIVSTLNYISLPKIMVPFQI